MKILENVTNDWQIGIGRATNQNSWKEAVWFRSEINGREQPILIINDVTAIKIGLRMLRCGIAAWLLQPTGRKNDEKT